MALYTDQKAGPQKTLNPLTPSQICHHSELCAQH